MEIGSGTTKGDHFVQFECTYSVSIQASPITASAQPNVVTITVPGNLKHSLRKV